MQLDIKQFKVVTSKLLSVFGKYSPEYLVFTCKNNVLSILGTSTQTSSLIKNEDVLTDPEDFQFALPLESVTTISNLKYEEVSISVSDRLEITSGKFKLELPIISEFKLSLPKVDKDNRNKLDTSAIEFLDVTLPLLKLSADESSKSEVFLRLKDNRFQIAAVTGTRVHHITSKADEDEYRFFDGSDEEVSTILSLDFLSALLAANNPSLAVRPNQVTYGSKDDIGTMIVSTQLADHSTGMDYQTIIDKGISFGKEEPLAKFVVSQEKFSDFCKDITKPANNSEYEFMFKTGEGSLSFSYKSSKVRVENQIKVKMVAESLIEFSVELPSLLALLKAFPLVSNKLVFYIYKPKVEIQCLADNEYTHNFILSRVM